MPFTFSHPAAVLPLTYLPKRWLSLTGLVVGSLTPDFEYFIRMRVHSSFSHIWAGMFWFNVPLAIILASVFHFVVRDKLIDSLPNILQGRFVEFKQFSWMKYLKKNLLVFIISCIIGTATHILWDSFTHQHGYFVLAINSLQQSVVVSGYSIPIYKILQHASSLFGGLLIIYTIWKLPMHSAINKGINWSYWLLTLIIGFLVLTLRAILGENLALGNLIVSVITGGQLGLILTSAILTWKYNGR